MADSITPAAGEAYRVMYREARARAAELEAALREIMAGVHWSNDDFRMYARDVLARTPNGRRRRQ